LLWVGEVPASKATTCGIAVRSMILKDLHDEITSYCILFVLDC